MKKIVPIIEFYKCIQTEGSKQGIPHILVRTTGCTHRCYFKEGGWCDSWYTSIHPEKGKFTLEDIFKFFDDNTSITHLMVTGGSPTMHPELVNSIVEYFNDLHLSILNRPFITLETEGSHYIETKSPIDLISLSPKFSNSIPQLGVQLPNRNSTVTEKLIEQHEKYRRNYGDIEKLLSYHTDYHFKPVVSKNNPEIWNEIEMFREKLNIPKHKTWIMPAGDTRDVLIPNYQYVIDECIKRGYNFTGRDHIIAFNDMRGV